MDAAATLTSAVDGNRIGPADALLLLEVATVPELGWAADRVCTAMHPERERTYVIDRNINYTNVCVSGCKFCAFFKRPNEDGGYVLSDEEILSKVDEAVALGATQIMLQGGLHPDLRIDYFEKLFKCIKATYPVALHSLSAPEIVHIAGVSGLSISAALGRLRDSGLDSLPGGGAELLCDEWRRKVSPGKCSADEWLLVMRTAAELGMKATATMVFGMGEELNCRIEHLGMIRDLQDETSVFTAFIPWTFQPGNTALGGNPVGAWDYLRTLAVCRLFLDNVANIQASWVTQGTQIAELALRFGANDLGSTMIEENVVAAAGTTYRMTEQDLVDIIHRAGFDAVQRTTQYGFVRAHRRRVCRTQRR